MVTIPIPWIPHGLYIFRLGLRPTGRLASFWIQYLGGYVGGPSGYNEKNHIEKMTWNERIGKDSEAEDVCIYILCIYKYIYIFLKDKETSLVDEVDWIYEIYF